MSSPGIQRYPAANADPVEDGKGRWTPGVVSAAIAIVAVVFCAQWRLALQLNAHDNLRMLNRFFDADNAWYLINFESGDQKFGSYGGRNIVHPNVANFVHPVVKAASTLAGLFSQKSKADLATAVSLAVAPAFAGIRSGLLFAALITGGFCLADALLVTALGSVALSSVVFGCLPESFVISGAFFAFYFLLVARSSPERGVRYGWWILSGTLLSSATITNLAPFALGLLVIFLANTRKTVAVSSAPPKVLTSSFPRWRRAAAPFALWSFFKGEAAFRKTVVITSASLAATMVCFVILTAAHGTFRGIGRRVGQLEEVQFNAGSLFIGFPRTLALTLVGVRPNEMTGRDEELRSQKIQVVRFTYRHDLERIKQAVPTITSYQEFGGNPVVEWMTIGLMLAGALLSSRVLALGSTSVKALYAVSVAHLLTHWLLHSFFGLELFLYSQHWLVPLVIVIGCGLTLRGRYRWMARAVVGVLLMAVVYQSSAVMGILMRE